MLVAVMKAGSMVALWLNQESVVCPRLFGLVKINSAQQINIVQKMNKKF